MANATTRKSVNTWGVRRRFKGGMGLPARVNRKLVCAPRSNTHGGHSSARAGWSCDDTHDGKYGKTGVETKGLKGEHKVEMPRNRIRYVRPLDG